MSRFESYARAWRKRWERERDEAAARAVEARATAERLAALLRDRHGATRVVLFGSLARGEFGANSDLDLAAAGIPPDRFFRAGADPERAAGGLHVDLVPLESASSHALACIASDGIVLHDSDAA